jgi:hypothetical protein
MTKDVNIVKKFTSFGRLVRESAGFLNKFVKHIKEVSSKKDIL